MIVSPTACNPTEYAERGYALVRNWLDPDLCAKVVKTCVSVEKPLSAWVEQGQLHGHQKILNAVPWLREILTDADHRAPIEALLGKSVSLRAAMLITKPPKVGQRFPWHQDSAYYEPDRAPGEYAIVTLYLDAVTQDNGSMAIQPGSHHQGKLHHERGLKMLLPKTQYGDETAVLVPAQIGDALVMDLHLVHGSQPNVSTKPRRTIRIGYAT